MSAARRIPQRTCIACRTTSDKRKFVRIVRTPTESVEIDLTGKKAGRGAYVCRRPECWDAALRKNRLALALRTTIGADDQRRLREFAAALKETAAV